MTLLLQEFYMILFRIHHLAERQITDMPTQPTRKTPIPRLLLTRLIFRDLPQELLTFTEQFPMDRLKQSAMRRALRLPVLLLLAEAAEEMANRTVWVADLKIVQEMLSECPKSWEL